MNAWTLTRIAEYRREATITDNGRLRIATRQELGLHSMAMHPVDCARALFRD